LKGTIREKTGGILDGLLGGGEEKDGEKKGGLLKRLGIK